MSFLPTYLPIQTIDAEIAQAGGKSNDDKEEQQQLPQPCYLLFASYSHRLGVFPSQQSPSSSVVAVRQKEEEEGKAEKEEEEEKEERIWLGQVFAQRREALSDRTWQKSILSNR